MSNIPIPEIHPILDTVSRPFWSVMIPTYNRPSFLKKTIRSVLDQDPGPEQMQIEVIDNFSEDFNIPEFVKDVSGGRVLCFRQPQKVDFHENWTTCIRRSRGKWVHILHDDDMVLPGFYSEYQKFIEIHPQVDLVFSQAKIINENDEVVRTFKPSIPNFPGGVLSDPFRLLLLENFIYSTSAVVSRNVYEKVGGFDPNLMHTIDWDLWLRISLHNTIGYVNKPLLAYRTHLGSGSNTQNNSTDLIDKKYEDISYIINNYKKYLPENLQKSYYHRFMRTFAVSANHQVKILLHEKNYQPAFHHAIWSKKMYPSFLNTCRYWWYYLRYFQGMH